MKTLIFDNGDQLPGVGLGTWKMSPKDACDAILEALKLGYRHIDCAAIYGNEKQIGHALETAFAEGIVERKDLWITSKLWCNAHRRQDVLPALEKTLSDLKLDYLDLYLMHWPIAMKPQSHSTLADSSVDQYLSLDEVPLAETWQAMHESGINKGLVRHIGVSNFSVLKLEKLTSETGIKPAMNQVELHPFFQQPALVSYCNAHNIHMTAYTPLAKASHELMENPVITDISNRHQCTPAQTILAWNLGRNISVIPKSVHTERLTENLYSGQIELSENEIKAIHSIDKHQRHGKGFFPGPDSPYTYENVWDEPQH